MMRRWYYLTVLMLGLVLVMLYCGKSKKKAEGFLALLDEAMNQCQYGIIINQASDTLKMRPDLPREFKKEIYWRYAVAISLRNYGVPHYTILDSLKFYHADSLYTEALKIKIDDAEKAYLEARRILADGDIAITRQKLGEALKIFPTMEPAQLLNDSLTTLQTPN